MTQALLWSSWVLGAGVLLTEPESEPPFYVLPNLQELAADGMHAVVGRYSTDRRTLERFFDASLSPTRRQQQRQFLTAWRDGLAELDFAALSHSDQIDWLLLENRLRYRLRRVERGDREWQESAPYLPFAAAVIELQERRRRLEPVEPSALATQLAGLAEQVTEAHREVEAALGNESAEDDLDPLFANRLASEVQQLRQTLSSWFRYYDGYDPLFSWWCKTPYGAVEDALQAYRKLLREKVAGVKEEDSDTILGLPIGEDALQEELEREMIPYTAAELIEIAQQEFAWCDAQMLQASRDLGHGEDWRAALEYVKTLHVQPGEQPALIKQLADEAVEFLEARELLTIPAFAKNVWRMEMMSAERQKLTPYFTGGEVISVSFPTAAMEHADKLMSLRGNNIHFSRATVHHELIPGHHLQGYMNARHQVHRRAFSTPFWVEGWALYWEMLLWDEGFPQSAEDRVGMLFWRRHRCARIIFSLSFHLGTMTAAECIDFLVERVGHERRNATAEVRRSVQGGYGPLYQAAYMVGGLQFRALYRELVQSGTLSNRDFHDAILRENSIPVCLVRAILIQEELTPDFRSRWRFYPGI